MQTKTRLLAGFSVVSKPATGDKATRAKPASAQAEAGNVKLLRGDWNEAFLDEVCAFPNAAHDDQVDAFADALNELALGGSYNIDALI
ncbi:phage terminase large subunit [Rhizorhabdus histidinilytica]